MRNPVGPLPSSIYWRRRVVVLCLLALLTLLVIWAVTSGADSGANTADGTNGKTPATSITPGPTVSSSGAISGRPGGRDPSDGASSGGSSTDTGSTDTGGTDNGAADGGGPDGGSGTGGTDAGSGGTSSGGVQLPAGSSLPDCTTAGVKVKLRSAKSSYEPGEKPEFVLTATNSSATACKLDFGAASAVLDVSAMDDDHVWATDDCPSDKSAYLLQVPADSSTSYTVMWSRKTSAPQCATPSGASSAPVGTYWVEAKLGGFAAVRTSFALSSV